MSKSNEKANNSTPNDHLAKPESITRVVKASPAKTTVAKETIRSAVLAVRLSK